MILNFTIHRANDLPVADVCFTDGYVIVRLNGKIIFRTRTFYKSLNPIWNEFSFVDIPSRQNSILRFEIYDTDAGKDDDLIGFYEVNLSSVPFNEPEKERRCPITNVGGYHGSSSIVISLLLQRDQLLQFPADDSLAPEEMMLISKAFQSKWLDRPMKGQSEFYLFLVQIDFTWNFIISDIDEYLQENKLAHLKYLLECFYTELLDSFYALKSSLQVLPQSSATTGLHVTSFPSNSANSSRESQFRELIFYLFRNNRKFLLILQSKSSFFLNSLSSEQNDSLLFSYHLDYSKLLEEYQYVLLWKINYFISLRNLNPSQEFLERNILQELQTSYQEFIQLYNEFKDNQCDLYRMEMHALSDFFHSFPLMYSTLLLQFAEHLKIRSNCQNINTNTNTSLNHVNVKNDSWYCSILNICSFILESTDWKFSGFSSLPSSIESSFIQEQYERSIPEVIHRYQLLQEDALHQLSNIIMNLIYSQFLANINEHPLTTSSSSSSTTTTTSRTSSQTQTLFNFSSPNLYLAYQQKILSNGHFFQLFSNSFMKEILLNKRFDSLRMWGASLKSSKQFQSLQLEIINKFFSIFYQLLSSCYDFYSKEFIHYQKCNEHKSLLPSFSNWIIDQEILSSLASDMNECLDLLSSKYFIDPEKKKMMMMNHPSIHMMQMIVNLLLTSEEYFNRADKMKDIFKQAREVLAGAPDYTKERIQQVLKICFALKGYYFYFNQVPSLFSMNLHDFFLSRTDAESISSHSSSSSSVEQERPLISVGRGKSLFQSVSSLFRLSRRIDSSSPGSDTARRERSYLVHPNITNVTAIETVIVEMDQFSDYFPTISSPHTLPRDSEGSIPRIDAFMLMFPSEEYVAILRESLQSRSSSGSSCYSFEEELLSSSGYFTLFQSLSQRYYSNSFLRPPPSGSSARRIVKIDQLKVFNLLYCAPPVGPTILMEGEAPKPSIHFELIPYSSALLSSSSSSSYSDAASSFKTEDTNIRVQKLSAWDQESLLLSIPSATETVQLLSLEMKLKYQTTSQGMITVGRCAFPMVSYLLKPFLHDRDRDRGSPNHFYSFQEPVASSSLSVPRMVSRAYSDARHEERPFPCLGFSLSAV